MSKLMQALLAQDGQISFQQIPQAEAQAQQLLLKVHATAVNRADLLQVAGHYPPPPGAPQTLGLEAAGEILTPTGNWKAGQRVMALMAGGGYAEFAAVHAGHCLPIPENLSYAQAAAIPEAFLTAYNNLMEIGGLVAGERVLIHAAASGVGLAAIQMAKLIGAEVIGTASAGKHAVCYQHGADRMIDYQSENFAEVVGEVDIILDMIGASYWEANLKVLKKWGRLVVIGLMGGAKVEANLSLIMQKRLTITGSTLRDRSDERKSALVARFGKWALPLFQTGQLQPTIWKVFPLAEAQNAHDAMRNQQNAGKIVLTLP